MTSMVIMTPRQGHRTSRGRSLVVADGTHACAVAPHHSYRTPKALTSCFRGYERIIRSVRTYYQYFRRPFPVQGHAR
eukprot:16829-Eustigmatos_ZCMA.PRE.1